MKIRSVRTPEYAWILIRSAVWASPLLPQAVDSAEHHILYPNQTGINDCDVTSHSRCFHFITNVLVTEAVLIKVGLIADVRLLYVLSSELGRDIAALPRYRICSNKTRGEGGVNVPPVAIDIYMMNLEKLTGRQTFWVASIYRPALRFGMENGRAAQIDLFQITNRCLLETGMHWKVSPLWIEPLCWHQEIFPEQLN
jgi:hypothetical protein